MRKGTIVLLPFPYTDLSGNKIRPALILFEDINDIIVAFISTQIKFTTDNNIVLTPDSLNGLKKISILKLDKIATIDKILVLGEIGLLDAKTINEANKKLTKILQLQ